MGLAPQHPPATNTPTGQPPLPPIARHENRENLGTKVPGRNIKEEIRAPAAPQYNFADNTFTAAMSTSK